MLLTNGAITINKPANEVDFYLGIGYKRIEEPVEIPAPKQEQAEPEAEPESVQASPVVKPKKAVKK
jgi:hypothetical protein